MGIYEWYMKEFKKFTPLEYERYHNDIEKTVVNAFLAYLGTLLIGATLNFVSGKFVGVVLLGWFFTALITLIMQRDALNKGHYKRYVRL